MSSVPIGKVGKILLGSGAVRFVKVVDDADSTGGFLILTSANPTFVPGYDDWVQDSAALAAYFQEAGWVVDWSK